MQQLYLDKKAWDYLFEHPEVLQKLLESFGLQDLEHMWQNSMDALIVGCITSYAILAVVVVFMIVIFAKKGALPGLPTFVKIALPSYLIYAVYACGIFLYLSTLDVDE